MTQIFGIIFRPYMAFLEKQTEKATACVSVFRLKREKQPRWTECE